MSVFLNMEVYIVFFEAPFGSREFLMAFDNPVKANDYMLNANYRGGRFCRSYYLPEAKPDIKDIYIVCTKDIYGGTHSIVRVLANKRVAVNYREVLNHSNKESVVMQRYIH